MFFNCSKLRAGLAVFLVILMETAITGGWNVSCSAPEVVEGSEARLTCSFGDDVRSASPKPTVKVRMVHSDFNNVRDTILECDWDESSLKCRPVKDGYFFNMTVTDSLTIRIPNVTPAFAGKYVCLLVPLGDDIPQPCNLSVTERASVTTENTATIPASIAEETTTLGTKNRTVTVVEPEGSSPTGLIVVVVILAVYSVVLTVLLILIKRRFIRKCLRLKGSTSRESTISQQNDFALEPLKKDSNVERVTTDDVDNPREDNTEEVTSIHFIQPVHGDKPTGVKIEPPDNSDQHESTA